MTDRRILIVGADLGFNEAMIVAISQAEGKVVVLDSCEQIERRLPKAVTEPVFASPFCYDNTAQWKRECGYGPRRAPLQRTIRGGKR